MISMAFEIEEEECLVTLLVDARNIYRATYGYAKLIAMRIRTRVPMQIIEVVVGVERPVAQIVVHVAVQTAASGLGHDIDHISCAPAVLRGERILLDLELLHVVGRGHVNNTSPAFTGIPRAVEKERCRSEVSAAKVEERDVLIGRALLSAGRNRLPLGSIVNRGVQFDKVEYVAEIERQLCDLLSGDFRADIGVVRLQQRCRSRDLDLLRRPDRQGDI